MNNNTFIFSNEFVLGKATVQRAYFAHPLYKLGTFFEVILKHDKVQNRTTLLITDVMQLSAFFEAILKHDKVQNRTSLLIAYEDVDYYFFSDLNSL